MFIFQAGAVALAFAALACANAETTRVEDVASTRFSCPRDDLEAALNRQTPQVREYVVGCDFTYMRVHCRGEHCQPAPAKPPCVGNLPCFEENPVTLQYELPDRTVP